MMDESSLVTDLVNGSWIAFQGPDGRMISRWTWFSIRGRMRAPLWVEVGRGLRRLIAKSVLELLVWGEEVCEGTSSVVGGGWPVLPVSVMVGGRSGPFGSEDGSSWWRVATLSRGGEAVGGREANCSSGIGPRVWVNATRSCAEVLTFRRDSKITMGHHGKNRVGIELEWSVCVGLASVALGHIGAILSSLEMESVETSLPPWSTRRRGVMFVDGKQYCTASSLTRKHTPASLRMNGSV